MRWYNPAHGDPADDEYDADLAEEDRQLEKDERDRGWGDGPWTT